MVSYAQNFEDVILNRIFHDIQNGFYIDVGAWDPVQDSVTKHFYDKGWSGINVEPVKRFYDKFVEQRPLDTNLHCVLSNTSSEVIFTEYGDSGLSSYKEQFIPSELLNSGLNKIQYPIKSTTLASITKNLHEKEVHFLKIDVEGAELDVINGADWINFRPKIILVEAIKPKFLGYSDNYSYEPTWSEWESVLFNNGYEFGLFDGLNRFYYRKEDPYLAKILSAPANVTDGFTLCKNHSLTYRELQNNLWKSILIFRTLLTGK